MTAMSRRERVSAAISGAEVDRPPISFWGHDYGREWSAEDHAAQTIEFVQKYDLDYVKINPRFSYLMEAWGGIFVPDPAGQAGPKPVRLPVHTPADLDRIHPAPAWSPSLVEQLAAARLVVRGLKADRPAVQTLFSPLGVLGNLVGGAANDGVGNLRSWLSEHAPRVHAALGAITETLRAFAAEFLNAGVDGVFYAPLTWATYENLTADQYQEFGRPYDLQVLAAFPDHALRILHVCRERNMLDRLLDYPVDVFHWDSHGAGNPSLDRIAAMTPKAVAGGVSNATLLSGAPAEAGTQARAALVSSGGRRLLLAGSCSISPLTPEANIRAVFAAVAPPG